jgi:hypothetical protein
MTLQIPHSWTDTSQHQVQSHIAPVSLGSGVLTAPVSGNKGKIHTTLTTLYFYCIRLYVEIYGTLEHVVAQWFRRYATSQKVAGSRLDQVSEFYQFT